MKCLLFLMGFLNLALIVFAQNTDSVIVLKDKNELKLIGKQTFFLEDDTEKMSIEDVVKANKTGKFVLNNKEVFARPATRSAFWFKITVQNQSNEDSWLEVGTTFAQYLDFYAPDSLGKYGKAYLTGTMRPENEKYYELINGFWLPLNKASDQQSKTYYLRVTEELPYELPLQVGTLRSLHQNKDISDYLTAGFVGLMLIMTLYNGFIYISTKNPIYIYYLGYLIIAIIASTFLNGYNFLYNTTWMHKNFLLWNPLTVLFTGMFCIQYLQLKTSLPVAYRIVVALVMTIFLFPILNLFSVRIVDLVSTYQVITILFYFSCWFSALILVARKVKSARFYAFGWLFLIGGVFVFIFTINGLIPFNPFIRNAIYFGVALEVWMFSLALADKINIMRKEKEMSQKALFEKKQENEKILAEQNTFLEQKVTEKTKDLQEKVEELAVTNEELYQTQEEILAQRDILEDKNQLLSDYSQRIGKSIEAAKAIQNTILPSEEKMKELFDEHFVIFKPKDTVSGDFWWANKILDKKYLIVADCTGHGVSGAMLTMIGASLLDRIILLLGITEPAQILERLHQEVKIALQQEQNGSIEGMDIAITCWHKQKEEIFLSYSAAKRPLYYALNGKIEKISGTRRNIGGNIHKPKAFESQQFSLPKDSILYLSSDGYADQNDLERKSFSEKRLLDLLQEIQFYSLKEQKDILKQQQQTHMEGVEQRDDILLIGVKI